MWIWFERVVLQSCCGGTVGWLKRSLTYFISHFSNFLWICSGCNDLSIFEHFLTTLFNTFLWSISATCFLSKIEVRISLKCIKSVVIIALSSSASLLSVVTTSDNHVVYINPTNCLSTAICPSYLCDVHRSLAGIKDVVELPLVRGL